jgi:hypothetical protein
MKEDKTRDRENPLVSICCLTYNHESFIRDALDGFLNQKTSFPFEIVIYDDASTGRLILSGNMSGGFQGVFVPC